jgi:hypothetical protein
VASLSVRLAVNLVQDSPVTRSCQRPKKTRENGPGPPGREILGGTRKSEARATGSLSGVTVTVTVNFTEE